MHPSAADRITTFASTPSRALDDLEDLEAQVAGVVESDPSLMSRVAGIEVPEMGNSVTVEATDVAVVEAALTVALGSLDGINLIQGSLAEPVYSREHTGGRIKAGDRVWNDWTPSEAHLFTTSTAGFGAHETTFIKEEKRYVRTPFMVTAGHTGNLGTLMYREQNGRGQSDQYLRQHGEKIGRVGRDALTQGTKTVDALALRLVSEDLVPKYIVGGGAVTSPAVVGKHQMVCASGAHSDKVKCGRVIGFSHVTLDTFTGSIIGEIVVHGSQPVLTGDSGGPVWRKSDHASIGEMSGYRRGTDQRVWLVQPLLTTDYGHGRRLVGALNASVMGSGSLEIARGQ